jgi:hypothetical protein
MQASALTTELATRFAEIALAHVTREYPNKLDHVLTAAADVQSPRALHPLFYGSFDWHSCVHGYWLLTRLRRTLPELAVRARIDALFDQQLTPENVAAECAYLGRPHNGTFERPYGWAWLLMLSAELHAGGPAMARWHQALMPLAQLFAQRLRAHLPKLTYPIRVGTHFNSAFAIALALDYASTHGEQDLADLIRERAKSWFAADAGCQAWEPGGDDFLSSALMEAECMRRVMGREEFTAWFMRFLPNVAAGEPRTLFTPATVTDRSDGKIAHLDGFNLSRAWCWRGIASAFSSAHPVNQRALGAAQHHLAASLPYLAVDYMGAHWLASYALLALTPGTLGEIVAD